MTCKNIYDHAMALLAESDESTLNDDYRERTPYLLASLCTELARTDRIYRESVGEADQPPFNSVELGLESEFPLCDRFAPAAAYFVASMLLSEDNTELSDKLYSHYSDAVSSIIDETPVIASETVDVYGFDY